MNSAGLYNRDIVNSVDIFNDISAINRLTWNDIGMNIVSCEHVMNNFSCANTGRV
jgi:hypothetical protein